MRKTLALILALVLALSCMGFAVAEPVAEQVEEAVAEIEEVAIGAAAEDAELFTIIGNNSELTAANLFVYRPIILTNSSLPPCYNIKSGYDYPLPYR